MKRNKLFALTFLLLASIACALPFGGGNDSPTAPEAPGQGDDPAASDLPEGPDSLDLSDASLFVTTGYNAYSMNVGIVFEGTGVSGNPVRAPFNTLIEERTMPDEAQRYLIYGEDMSDALVYVKVNGQIFSVFPGAGCSVLPADSQQDDFNPREDMIDFTEVMTGSAERAQTGVVVEGIVTDRYTLTQENVPSIPDLDSFSFKEGSVYLSRAHHKIVKMEITGTLRTSQYDLDANQDASFTFNYQFIPYEDGSLAIQPPVECIDASFSLDQFPVIEGATGLSSVAGAVFYQYEGTLKEVLDFYRTEMAAQGYELSKDTYVDTLAFATLSFTKDGSTVDISAIQNGKAVAVNIKSTP